MCIIASHFPQKKGRARRSPQLLACVCDTPGAAMVFTRRGLSALQLPEKRLLCSSLRKPEELLVVMVYEGRLQHHSALEFLYKRIKMKIYFFLLIEV